MGTVKAECYTETHHILPKSMDGSNDVDNLVVLTGKEHFICHYLLTKIYPEVDSMVRAFQIMCNRTKGKTANDYCVQRERFAKISRNRVVSEETRAKMRIIGKRQAQDPEYLKRVSEGVLRAYATTDLREKVSKASIEMWKCPIRRKQMSIKMKECWDCPKLKLERSELIKKQNIENPELLEKRLKAIENHQQNKSKEWIEDSKVWIKEWYDRPENKDVRKERYFVEGNKFNNSRLILNKETGELYRSMQYAAEQIGMNYSTVKKYLYNGKDFVLEFYKEEEYGK